MAHRERLPRITVGVKCRNEAAELRRLLESIRRQRYPQELVDIVVADNESTDSSAAVARQFGARVIHVPYGSFSYPKATNLLCRAATGEYVVLTVAHAELPHRNWLRAGLRHFGNPRVASVFGHNVPFSNAPLLAKLFYAVGSLQYRLRWLYDLGYLLRRTQLGRRLRLLEWRRHAAYSFTGAMLRRSLWAQTPFDERMENGGEDSLWAEEVRRRGYLIIKDPSFSIRHSHALRTFGQFRAQLKHWGSFHGSAGHRPLDRAALVSFRPEARRWL